MPRLDGTGPLGTGPAGGGRGGCFSQQQTIEDGPGPTRGAGQGRGRGMGRCARGTGRRFGGQGCAQRGAVVSTARSREEEIALIELQIIALQTQLTTLKDRS